MISIIMIAYTWFILYAIKLTTLWYYEFECLAKGFTSISLYITLA